MTPSRTGSELRSSKAFAHPYIGFERVIIGWCSSGREHASTSSACSARATSNTPTDGPPEKRGLAPMAPVPFSASMLLRRSGRHCMADHLAHAHPTVRQLGPFRPERENDPVCLGDRVRHLLGLIRREIQHLDISCGDLCLMIMPHLFPYRRGDDLLVSRHRLAYD